MILSTFIIWYIVGLVFNIATNNAHTFKDTNDSIYTVISTVWAILTMIIQYIFWSLSDITIYSIMSSIVWTFIFTIIWYFVYRNYSKYKDTYPPYSRYHKMIF